MLHTVKNESAREKRKRKRERERERERVLFPLPDRFSKCLYIPWATSAWSSRASLLLATVALCLSIQLPLFHEPILGHGLQRVTGLDSTVSIHSNRVVSEEKKELSLSLTPCVCVCLCIQCHLVKMEPSSTVYLAVHCTIGNETVAHWMESSPFLSLALSSFACNHTTLSAVMVRWHVFLCPELFFGLGLHPWTSGSLASSHRSLGSGCASYSKDKHRHLSAPFEETRTINDSWTFNRWCDRHTWPERQMKSARDP